MTEKRFTIGDRTLQEVYECCIPAILDGGIPCTQSQVLKLLNELHEDNQLLHKMNAETIDFMYDNFDLNIMFTDRDLNNICNEMGWELSEKGIKLNQLENENEQLKQRNDRLEEKIQRERRVSAKQHLKWNKEAENKIKELSDENEHYKSIFFELVETALTDKNCRELYCKGILDIFDKANSLNQAREMIKEHLK